MAATITTQVTCPMHAQGNGGHLNCGGELVEAKTANQNTQWKIAPCSSLIAQGWGKGPQAVVRFTEIDSYLPAQTVLRHHDGLVTFG